MVEKGARRADRPGGAKEHRHKSKKTTPQGDGQQAGLLIIRTRKGIVGTVVAAGGQFIAYVSTDDGSRQIGSVQPSRKAAVAMIEGAAHAAHLHSR